MLKFLAIATAICLALAYIVEPLLFFGAVFFAFNFVAVLFIRTKNKLFGKKKHAPKRRKQPYVHDRGDDTREAQLDHNKIQGPLADHLDRLGGED